MKLKMIALVVVLTTLLAGCSDMFGKYPIYEGPRTPEAALEYVQDGKDAIDSLLEAHPKFKGIIFQLRKGAVVVLGSGITDSDLRLIANEFVSHDLWIEAVYHMSGQNRILREVHVIKNHKGKARYFALNRVEFPRSALSP